MADFQILVGDCLEILPHLTADSVDAIVTDPPYGLEFMGKDWDAPWKQNPHIGATQPGIQDVKMADGFERLPRPIYERRANVKCRNCNRWRVSSNPCRCPEPDFPNMRNENMAAFQMWATQWAAELLRVAKPGAHLAAFGGARTFHRLTVAIEDAGWEIRDTLCWLYGSGFPKSLDVSKAIDKAAGVDRAVIGTRDVGPDMRGGQFASAPGERMLAEITEPTSEAAKQWEGWGTALKPAWEPIILARKRVRGAVALNVLEHGTGALNVGACRIQDAGRWPANVVLDEEAASELDAHTGEVGAAASVRGDEPSMPTTNGIYEQRNRVPGPFYGDQGGASRFFYTAKASRSEREEGLDQFRKAPGGSNAKGFTDDVARGVDRNRPVANNHPTVKPLELMRWLCRLITPSGGMILDPFTGSGSTGCAALAEGFDFTGIELSDEYAELARARILHHGRQHTLGL